MIARTKFRSGLTLLELIVVLSILVALATLVVPIFNGVNEHTNTATNAAILQGINEAVGRFESQTGMIPTDWDGLLTSSGVPYTSLDPKLNQLDNGGAAGTTLGPQALSEMQAQSLKDAGMTGVYFQDESWNDLATSKFPSDSGRNYVPIAASVQLMFMSVGNIAYNGRAAFNAAGGANVLFADRAFSLTPFTTQWNNNFIVVGFGNQTSLKRNSVRDTPLFQSVRPTGYYRRGLCVFMVPPASVTSTAALGPNGYFRAKYIGCFAPDGTCLMDNMNKYMSQQTPN